MKGQVYASDKGPETGTQQPEGHETGLSELREWPRIWAPRRAQGRIQSMLRLLRAAQGCSGSATVLHSHSSGLLIHRSGYGHVCSGLKVEMEFGEVKIGVRVLGHPEGNKFSGGI
jgi:hypothetical protein